MHIPIFYHHHSRPTFVRAQRPVRWAMPLYKASPKIAPVDEGFWSYGKGSRITQTHNKYKAFIYNISLDISTLMLNNP